MSLKSIEEMFGKDREGQPALPPEDCARIRSASALLQNLTNEQREAIRHVAGFYVSADADQLMHDESLDDNPVLAARLRGRKNGMDKIVYEITDPAALAETVEWIDQMKGNKD